MNPLAVEIAAREGARIVWLPTVDSLNETDGRTRSRPAPSCRCGCGCSTSCASRASRSSRSGGRRRRRAAARDARGARRRRPPRHGARDRPPRPRRDLRGGRRGAWRRASRRSSSPTPSSRPRTSARGSGGAGRQRRAARALLHDAAHRQVTWERVARGIRAVGPEHSVLSTDLGQVFNPPVEDGLALMADRLLARASTRRRSTTMAVTNTRRLARGAARDAAGCWSIGAHSADFVWRAGGAVAVAASAAGRPRSSRCPTASAASPASCGRRRARRSRTSSRSATARPSARPPALGADFRCLDLGDYPLQIDAEALLADRRRDPRVRARRARSPTPTATRSTPITRSPHVAVDRARGAGGRRGRAERLRRPSRRRQLFLFEPHQPELCNFTPTTFVDITPVFERKLAAMARDEGAELPADLLRPARRAARQPRAARLGRRGVRYAEAFQRVIPQVVSEL